MMIGRPKTSQMLLTGLFIICVTVAGYSQRPFPAQRPRNPAKQDRLPNPKINRNPGNNPANRQLRMRQQILRDIGISEGQQMRIREVLRSHEDDRIAGNRRLRQARRALDEAVMSSQIDEGLIQRRADELAAAQANQIRLQSRIRTEVRKVLTPEQVNKFNQLEEEMRNRIREQRRQEMQQEQPATKPPDTPDQSEFDLTQLLWPANG